MADADDRAVGGLDEQSTRERLERLFGEKIPEPQPTVARPPLNAPVTPPAQRLAQYHVGPPQEGVGAAPSALPTEGPAGAAARSGARSGAGGRSSGVREAPPAGGTPTDRSRRRQGSGLPRPKLKWLRPKLRWFTLYLPLLVVLALLGGALWAWRTFDAVERVPLGNAITPATGSATNYLIVGSDTRANVDPNAPDAAAIGVDVAGERADTIIVLRVGDGTSKMMSVPRDLWVTNVATKRQGRINGSFNQGRDNLARTVTASLGVELNHYVEVDFVSFAQMVDAMGGITIDFPHPVFDPNSGLRIDAAGPQVLDGQMALAYVRSRKYTEIIDGKEVRDPTADLGRQQRQQNFIRTVLEKAGSTRNPITLAKLASAAGGGVKIDDTFGITDAWTLARRLSGGTPETVVLPTAGARKGNASVLVLDEAAAQPVLAEFRNG